MRIRAIAWRNLWRNPRRSGVTIAAMAFALWVMILYTGLVAGMLQGMESDLVDLELGELSVVAEGYRDDPSLFRTIESPQAVLEGLDALGLPAAPRLLGGGLGAVGEESAGIQLVGLDPARDAQVTEIADRVAAGAWVSAEAPEGVVLGRNLARTLNAEVGSELLVLSQGADGSIANALFEVRGVLGQVGAGVDQATVFLVAPAFRELMVLPEGAHQLTVRVPEASGLSLEEAKARTAALGEGLEVQTWRELVPTLSTMLDSTAGLVQVVAVVVYLAIAILVLNAMLMAVFERIREFGVLKAIGWSGRLVFTLIAVESLAQVLLASVLGILLALPAMAWLSAVGIDTGALGGATMMGMSMRDRWTGIFGPDTVLVPTVILWVMVGLAVIWPALKAARLRPLEAMRYR